MKNPWFLMWRIRLLYINVKDVIFVTKANKDIFAYINMASISEMKNLKIIEEQMQHITHVLFLGFVNIHRDGEIRWNEDNNSSMEKMLSLIQIAKKNNVKTLLTLITKPLQARTFMCQHRTIESLSDFIDKYGLDGIDIDYETPETEEDWFQLSSYLIELKNKLKAKEKIVITTFYPHGIKLTYEAIQSIDYVNAMVYDMGKYHSTYENATEGITYFQSLGFRDNQINLGIPFYGREIEGKPLWIDYKDIIMKYGSNIKDNQVENIYFNNQDMVRKKAELASNKKLNGVMIWHLSADLPYNHKESLLGVL